MIGDLSKRVVVTGASGHIGFHVASCLRDLNYPVLLLIRNRNSNIVLLEEKGCTIEKVNLNQPATYSHLIKGISCLFHLASENTTSVDNEAEIIASTYGISRTVIDTALSNGVKTIIYTSSVVVLGRSENKQTLINEKNIINDPSTPYIKGKYLAEKYIDGLIKQSRADIRRLYPSWVIGSRNVKVTPPQQTINDYTNKGQLFYFDGGISIADVGEVAGAHVNAWLVGKPGEKYVLGGQNLTFKNFYSTLAGASAHKKPFIFLPKFLIYIISYVGTLVFKSRFKVQPSYVKEVIGKYSWYDSSKAINELGYKIPPPSEMIAGAIKESLISKTGLNNLYYQKNILNRIKYKEDDLLLITGFPGWLGNRMADIFLNGDKFGQYAIHRKVRLLVQPRFKNLISLPPNYEIVYGDLSDKFSLLSALNGVKAVYHLAGVIYPPKIKTFYEVNFKGTKNLVDACIEKGVRRILFMGTDSICGYGRDKRIFDENTPPSPYKNYGKSKYMAEKYILDKSKAGLIDGTSLRGFWFFGPFMPERNSSFFKMFKWKKQIVFGNGKNYRSISHIDNIIQAFILSEKSPVTYSKWYWIGGKKIDYTVNDIYNEICDGLSVKYKPLHIPNFFCDCFNVLDSFLGMFGVLNPTIHAAGKFHKDIAGEIKAAERDFGYNPKVDFSHIKKEVRELIH